MSGGRLPTGPFAAMALAAWPLLGGCSTEAAKGPPAPQTALTLDFEHVIGDAPVVIGSTYTTRYEQGVTFDALRYWVSNVALVRGSEEVRVPASYYLVEQTPEHERLSITIRGVPGGAYDALVFHIGVDPTHNKSLDLLEGELAPGIGMDWSWDTGYIFLLAEGEATQKDFSGKLSFHVGTDVLYKELRAEPKEPIVLEAGVETKLSFVAEVDRMFAGIQLAADAEVAGGSVDSPAAQVAGNYSRMFRLMTDDGEIALTASSPNIDPPVTDGTIPQDITPPVLTEPVIGLPPALACGAVKDRPASEERACVTPFLLSPESGATYDAGLTTFVTKNGEPVRSSSAGVVSDVSFIEHSMLTHSDLFMVTVRPAPDSAFFLEYRNVKDLKVTEGDPVAAGQILGGAGDYFNESSGLVSFGVRRSQEVTQRLCPAPFATPGLRTAYGDALTASNDAWPSHAETALCASASLLCTGGQCSAPADFVEARGDIDEGRRIYATSCAICHGSAGEGDIGPELCVGAGCTCQTCTDHAALSARIGVDMPPEGYCDPKCSADVAAFILQAFAKP